MHPGAVLTLDDRPLTADDLDRVEASGPDRDAHEGESSLSRPRRQRRPNAQARRRQLQDPAGLKLNIAFCRIRTSKMQPTDGFLRIYIGRSELFLEQAGYI